MPSLTSLWLAVAMAVAPFTAQAFEDVTSFEKNNSKLKVLLFLSYNCPCSKSHVDHLNEQKNLYKDAALFGVITDIFEEESTPEINSYFTADRFEFPLIRDDAQKLVKAYGALKTPHAVILERQANNTYKVIYQGGVTDTKEFEKSKKKFLGENLAALAKGDKLKYSEGKCLGCYIRRL